MIYNYYAAAIAVAVVLGALGLCLLLRKAWPPMAAMLGLVVGVCGGAWLAEWRRRNRRPRG